MEHNDTSQRFIKQSISFPRTQMDWLREEAARQEHGNISRLVQEAIKDYRDELEVRRARAAREMERVS